MTDSTIPPVDSAISIINPLPTKFDAAEMNEAQETTRLFENLRRPVVSRISPTVLRENVTAFVKELGAVLTDLDLEITQYQLEEIEVSAVLTAGGKLMLVAGQIEGSIQGSIKFKFTKR